MPISIFICLLTYLSIYLNFYLTAHIQFIAYMRVFTRVVKYVCVYVYIQVFYIRLYFSLETRKCTRARHISLPVLCPRSCRERERETEPWIICLVRVFAKGKNRVWDIVTNIFFTSSLGVEARRTSGGPSPDRLIVLVPSFPFNIFPSVIALCPFLSASRPPLLIRLWIARRRWYWHGNLGALWTRGFQKWKAMRIIQRLGGCCGTLEVVIKCQLCRISERKLARRKPMEFQIEIS